MVFGKARRRRLTVLFSCPGSDTDPTDYLAIDDYGKTPWEIDTLAFGRDRQLQIDALSKVAGRFPIRGCGRRFSQRGVNGEHKSSVHAQESQQVTTCVYHRDTLRD